jgi:hypothetical protein
MTNDGDRLGTKEARRAAVESAFNSSRMEGIEPSEAAKARFNRFIEGEISIDELRAEIFEAYGIGK